jgi:hypothetical protein
MLRVLRITGIITFAFLVGISANTLFEMHQRGSLLEKYNSSRKTNITLLGFSIFSLGALGYFEFSRIRRTAIRRGYGGSAYENEDDQDVDEGLDTTSIYSAPKTLDAWQGRRTHSAKSRSSRQQLDMTNVWMGVESLLHGFAGAVSWVNVDESDEG